MLSVTLVARSAMPVAELAAVDAWHVSQYVEDACARRSSCRPASAKERPSMIGTGKFGRARLQLGLQGGQRLSEALETLDAQLGEMSRSWAKY